MVFGSSPNGRNTFEPLTPTGPYPPPVPPVKPMPTLGLLGEPSELTVPGLAMNGATGSRVSLIPLGVKPTGFSPPSGPYCPHFCPGAGVSIPALASASTSTSSAIAQLSLDSPERSAARLALPVV